MSEQVANCRACGARIVFVTMQGTGRQNPVDERRLTIVTDDGRVITGRQSHFSTCPKAENFRRKA